MDRTRLRSVLAEQLQAGVVGDVFPGAAAVVGWREGEQWHLLEAQAGKLSRELGPVHARTIYDLASLTKPVAAMAALRLTERGVLQLNHKIATWLPRVTDHGAGQVTLRELLSHRAGFAAWQAFYEDAAIVDQSPKARWDAVIGSALQLWNPEQRGTALYSDLDYIILAQVLRNATSLSLRDLFKREVFLSLGLYDIDFASVARDTAPTGFSEWRARGLQGEVNDDNCALLGGQSAHAGLFATASDIARFGTATLDAHAGRSTWLKAETLSDALATQLHGTFRVGWDGINIEGASAFSARAGKIAFCHLGFTGTSLYCDPEREIVIVLLSNRVHPDAENVAIRRFRPRFHDALLAL